MKRKLFLSLFIISLLLTLVDCKKSDELEQFDVRGTWEINVSATNGNASQNFVLSGSKDKGTVTGGYSDYGSGIYSIFGKDVYFTYYSNLAGGCNYKFKGYILNWNEMKGSVIISQVVSPPFPIERTFDWNAKRK